MHRGFRAPSFGFGSSFDATSPPALDDDYFTFNIGAGNFGDASSTGVSGAIASSGSGNLAGSGGIGGVGGIGDISLVSVPAPLVSSAASKKRESLRKLEKKNSFFDLKSKREWRQKEENAEGFRAAAQSFR